MNGSTRHRILLFVTWSVVVMLLFGLAGCPRLAPVRSPPPDVALTPETVLSTLREREANLETLKGLFQVDVQTSALSFLSRVRGTVVYQRPQSIRITGMTFLGGAAFDFVAHDGTFVLRVPWQPNVMVGRVDDLTGLGEWRSPIQLSLGALQVLLGNVPMTADSEIRLEDESYRYTIPLSHGKSLLDFADGIQRVWVDRYSAQIRAIDYLTVDERTQLAFTASDFRAVRDESHTGERSIVLPFHVQARDRMTSGSMTLKFLELAANVSLSEKAFDFR